MGSLAVKTCRVILAFPSLGLVAEYEERKPVNAPVMVYSQELDRSATVIIRGE
jgi:hypothetical protein